MTFGQSSDFAIEAYHEPFGPEWAGFGRMAIDICGVRLGKIRENHCSPFDAAKRLHDISSVVETLWDMRFTALSDIEIFQLIDDALYVGEPTEVRDDYLRFDFLTNSGEQFDDAKTFIVCRPEGHVHILYQLRDDTCASASCTVSAFRQVVGTFWSWFEEQVRNATPPWHPVSQTFDA